MDSRPRSRFGALTTALVGLGLLLAMLQAHLAPKTGADKPACGTVWMGPSYARIEAFDETYTPYARKFLLYLYREQDKDAEPEGPGFLSGVPALFIPGNAGSYRQVRSIAAESANLHFDDGYGPAPYDFFAADFNEDYTAFHGRTALDQAEFLNDAIRFILGLYSHRENPPKAVLLLAHSMGGIVARTMLTLPNYEPGLVNTIVTLALPHAAAPLTFDGDVLRIYSAIDRFWHEGLSGEPGLVAYQRLKNVSLVSITGGLEDSMLPADYTALGFLVPPENGFTVYSTGIPTVWTPIDHLAVVWCAQLRRKVAEMLLSITDLNAPSRTLPLQKRMAVMREHLLLGFNSATHGSIDVTIEEECFASDPLIRLDQEHSVHAYMLGPDASKFSLLSLGTLGTWENGRSVMLCKHRDTEEGEPVEKHPESDNMASKNTDNSPAQGPSAQNDPEKRFKLSKSLHLRCVYADPITVPNPEVPVGELSFSGDRDPYTAVQVSSNTISKYDVVVVAGLVENDGFLVAHVSGTTEYTAGTGLSSLVTGGTKITIPGNPGLSTNIAVPGAWSSILSYRVEVHFAQLEQKFTPFVRQWSVEPYETKWHLGSSIISMSLHSVAPYTPFKPHNHLNIEVWLDPNYQNDDVLLVSISVDLLDSLRLLVPRYRLALVAFCLSVALLAFFFQLRIYNATKKFPSFFVGLSAMAKPGPLGTIMVVLSVLSKIVKYPAVQQLLNMVDPVVIQDANEINLSLHKDFTLNSFYLGLEEDCLWFLGPLFFVMAFGINMVLYLLLYSVGLLFNKILARTLLLQLHSSTRSRFVVTVAVLVLIALYLPYQFVYAISFFVQVIKAVRVFNKKTSNLNYHLTILILMVWILPINVPIFVVFVHNLTISWSTPFSSHHNLLAIMPILLLVERHSSRETMLPAIKHKRVTYGMLAYFVAYSMLYGVRHTFWLHHLFNVFACWLLVLYYENEPEKAVL